MSGTGEGAAPRRRAVRSMAALAALGLLVAACGSDDESADTGSGPGATSTAAAGSTDTEASEGVTDYVEYVGGEAGAADESLEPVTIGFVNTQGGAAGFEYATATAEAAARYINAELGGVGGHPLELQTCFIASAEEEGRTCALELVNDEDVDMVVFGTVPIGAQTFLDTNDGRKPVLLGNALGPGTATQAENVFVLNGTSQTLLGGLATYGADVLEAEQASIVYADEPLSSTGAESLEQALDAVGIEYTSVAFDASSRDLLAPLTAARVQDADVIYTISSAGDVCTALASALESLGVTGTPTFGDFSCLQDVVETLGDAPHWLEASAQSPVEDTSLPDVAAYLEAADAGGLTEDDLAERGTPIVWSTMLTAVRFLNAAGGAEATPEAIGEQAQSFTGPLVLGAPTIDCGAFADQPGLCGFQTRAYQYVGDGEYEAVSDWMDPPETD